MQASVLECAIGGSLHVNTTRCITPIASIVGRSEAPKALSELPSQPPSKKPSVVPI